MSVTKVTASWQVVEHEGRVYRVVVVRQGHAVWVGWPGGSVRLERDDEVARRHRREGAIRAPLTGRVIRVDARAGHEVEADAVLVVLEAMKMEYRLTAPRAGTVRGVHCAVGDLVEQGTTLVDLDDAASSGPGEGQG